MFKRFIRPALVPALVIMTAYLVTGCLSYSFRGSAVTPPETLPDFKLANTQGEPVSLSGLRGKVVLLYFGYTHCTDACPLTIAHFAQAKHDLGQDAEQVAFLFVTTDPDRDTSAVLRDYISRFDPAIIGLRGSPAELATIYQAYHVAAVKQEPGAGQAGYTVEHSDVIYVLDRAGRWREVLDSISNVADVESDVRYLVHE